MSHEMLLDTNAYALLFKRPKGQQYHRLVNRLKTADGIDFHISEITSLEIFSVIGKYRRGLQPQTQKCVRQIILPDKTETTCGNVWSIAGRRRLSARMYRDLIRLLSDIESRDGDIRATKIGLTENAIAKGTDLLFRYSDRYNFGSHDALIAGSLIDHIDTTGKKMILATSDKSFKAVLGEESIPVFDPNM